MARLLIRLKIWRVASVLCNIATLGSGRICRSHGAYSGVWPAAAGLRRVLGPFPPHSPPADSAPVACMPELAGPARAGKKAKAQTRAQTKPDPESAVPDLSLPRTLRCGPAARSGLGARRAAGACWWVPGSGTSRQTVERLGQGRG